MFIDLNEQDLLPQFPQDDDPRWCIAVVEYGGLPVWNQPNRESRIRYYLKTYDAYWMIYDPRPKIKWIPVRCQLGCGYAEQNLRYVRKVQGSHCWRWRCRKEIKIARNMIGLRMHDRMERLDKFLEQRFGLK